MYDTHTRSGTLGLLVATLVASTLLVGVARAEPLERAAASRVCMVNDTVYDKDQIPVAVEGRTYFGCCEMCKGRLAAEPALRQAIDPVSGKPVDKAKAVIGVRPDGKVLYFETEDTFTAFGKAS